MGLGIGQYFFGFGFSHFLPYLIYASVFIAIPLTLFYRVELGLFFVVPLIPLQPVWVKLWDFPLGRNLIDLMVLALLAGWFLRKKKLPGKTSLFLPVLILVAISFIGLFIGSSSFPLTTDNIYFKIWKNFVLMPLLYVITFNVIREERQAKILVYLMAFFMLANFFYFHSTFEWVQSAHFENAERISTFSDLGPNEMASFVSQGTMLFLGIWLAYRNKWSRLLTGAVILGNLYVILYSFSRGSYFAILAGLLVMGILKFRRLLVVLLLLGLFWHQILPTSVIERLEMTYKGDSGLDHASAVRVDVWQEGISTFLSNPLGVGFNKYRSLGLGDTGKRDAHNMFVKMLVELGIPGVLIYFTLYMLGLRSGWLLFRSAQDDFTRGLGLGFISCTLTNLICNLFGQDWLLISVTTYYWVFWALVERARIGYRESGAVFSPKPSLEVATNQ